MLINRSIQDSSKHEALQKKATSLRGTHLRQLFANDPARFEQFSIQHDDMLFDFSKQKLDKETMDLLFEQARECGLKEAIQAQFTGERINRTEDRSVLHTALRNFSDDKFMLDGVDILKDIREVLDKMKGFSEKVISGHWKGYTGKSITDVVNIGIGGSDLGPYMVTEALKPYANHLRMHYVSNVDGSHLAENLKGLDPETTLFCVVSKTFTTQETMANAYSAREWLLAKLKDESAVASHFVAVSTQPDLVQKFGIDTENMFVFWEWVGGRYSLWSAVGLSIALSVGFERFEELLKGAHEMDLHFRNSSFERNIPVILAMVGIWNVNYLGSNTLAVLPYDQYLHRFPAYLQQGDMESNGKSVDRNGKPVSYQTGPIVWGEPGTNGQHAFYQLIHQGTSVIPCDFIASANTHNPIAEHQKLLLANCLAQSKALMEGKNETEVLQELSQQGLQKEQIDTLLPFKVFKGDIPSTTILFDLLTPHALGKLIALYEHKIFVQGVLWNVFSYDQWGVELGKQLAKNIAPALDSDAQVAGNESSTGGLIDYIKEKRTKTS